MERIAVDELCEEHLSVICQVWSLEWTPSLSVKTLFGVTFSCGSIFTSLVGSACTQRSLISFEILNSPSFIAGS